VTTRVTLDYTHTPDDRVRARVFCSGQLAGELLLQVGEAQLLAAALALGAGQMQGHLLVEVRGYLSEQWAREQEGR
jgi:hypothetical protein